MLVHISTLLEKAKAKKYAIGAFNIENLETTLGVVRAATRKSSPIILQVSETSIQYAGLKAITSIVETVAEEEGKDIPIALHLDHGKSFRSVAECIRVGFTSIMMDASEMPFTENIILTKQAADFAHGKKAFIQGEVGEVKGLEEVPAEERNKLMTNPEEAEEFVEKTGVDTLAVAVGNVHGIIKMQKGNPGLDLEKLEAIHRVIPKIPLVLHGASGLPKEQIVEGLKRGIAIINIDTELRLAFTNALRNTVLKDPSIYDPRELLTPSIQAIQRVVEAKIDMFGSTGAAK